MDARAQVQLKTRERQFDGFFKLDRFTLRHPLYAGGMSIEKEREHFVGFNAVCCLPYDPDLDEVVLVEQFRIGPYVWGDENPWVVEAPAGLIDEGETPETTVHRELQEEAGCIVTDLTYATEFFPAQGSMSEHVRVYIGRTDASKVGGIHGLPGEGENIRVFTMPLGDAIANVDSGEIRTALGVAPLLWLARHRNTIRKNWGYEA